MKTPSSAAFRRSVAILVVGLAAFAASEPVAVRAKPELAKIEITGGGLTSPVVLTDLNIIRRFSVWTGPGTSDGWHAQRRAFIDWPKGEATQRPAGLPRYDVRFYWEVNGKPIYEAWYEFDPRKEGGFMYLSANHTNTILHGAKGRWFHSSSEWEKVIRPYLKTQQP